MTSDRPLQCFANGRDGRWEAICVDLDIAVEGRSLDDVRARLEQAIGTYVQDAAREDAATAHRLLSRRAPSWVRLRLAAAYAWHAARRRRPAGDLRAGFDLPCPA